MNKIYIITYNKIDNHDVIRNLLAFSSFSALFNKIRKK